MEATIIMAVMLGCSCTEDETREYLESEVDNLRDYMECGDLRSGDIAAAWFQPRYRCGL